MHTSQRTPLWALLCTKFLVRICLCIGFSRHLHICDTCGFGPNSATKNEGKSRVYSDTRFRRCECVPIDFPVQKTGKKKIGQKEEVHCSSRQATQVCTSGVYSCHPTALVEKLGHSASSPLRQTIFRVYMRKTCSAFSINFSPLLCLRSRANIWKLCFQ